MKETQDEIEPDWSKRSDMQYAYKKVMGIYPDVIKEIESNRELFRVVYESKNEKPNAGNILDYYREMHEHITPTFPEVPEHLKIPFLFYQREHRRMFSPSGPQIMSPENYKIFQKSFDYEIKNGDS